MSKLQILVASVIILMLANITLLCILFFNTQPKPLSQSPPDLGPNRGPRNYIIQQLELDENQIQQYDSLIVIHRREIALAEAAFLQTKTALYQSIGTQNSADSLFNQVAQLQVQIEQIHISHFTALSTLLKPKQLAAFQQLRGQLASFFSKPQRPRPSAGSLKN
jgi:Spy/CpxP family protein refolding chaperone